MGTVGDALTASSDGVAVPPPTRLPAARCGGCGGCGAYEGLCSAGSELEEASELRLGTVLVVAGGAGSASGSEMVVWLMSDPHGEVEGDV